MGIFNEHSTNNKSVQGKSIRGSPGIGFKIIDRNYDIQNKRLANLSKAIANNDAITKHQMEVGLSTKPYPTDVLLLNGQNHMTGDLDLRGNKIIWPGEIDMDQKLITNRDTDKNQDLSAVNMITLKNIVSPKAYKTCVDNKLTSLHLSDKNIDLKEKFNITNSKQQSFTDLSAHYDNLVSYNDVKDIFLSRKESFPMQTSLDMNNHFIYNVKKPEEDDQEVNKKYVDDSSNQLCVLGQPSGPPVFSVKKFVFNRKR